MKKLIALLLALAMCCSFMAACSSAEDDTEKEKETAVKDDGILKVLMIGHSLGNDTTFMLPEIWKNENAGPAVFGAIYHSGCRVAQHLDYINKNAAQYAYYEYDTTKDNEWFRADCNGDFLPFVPGSGTDTFIEDGSIAQTMDFGLDRHDWDIIITQAGVFEAANAPDSAYTVDLANDIPALLEYVLSKDIQPKTKPQIAWNITWTCPGDEMLNDSYKTNLYGNFTDATAMYEAIVKTAQEVVAPAYDFDYIFPSGTAMQNARVRLSQSKDLYRDFIHANDFGRLVVGYTVYCMLTGADINTCNFGAINSKVLVDNFNRNSGTNFEMTEQQKTILIESVSNALATPYAMTQSAN